MSKSLLTCIVICSPFCNFSSYLSFMFYAVFVLPFTQQQKKFLFYVLCFSFISKSWKFSINIKKKKLFNRIKKDEFMFYLRNFPQCFLNWIVEYINKSWGFFSKGGGVFGFYFIFFLAKAIEKFKLRKAKSFSEFSFMGFYLKTFFFLCCRGGGELNDD